MHTHTRTHTHTHTHTHNCLFINILLSPLCRSKIRRYVCTTHARHRSLVPLQLLLRQSADTVKRLSLELGGNGPCLVFDSARMRTAVDGAFLGKFRNGGQVRAEL